MSTETQPANVIVVGAGLAGIATGIAMRASGHKVTVLEQSTMKSEVGAAIQYASAFSHRKECVTETCC